MEAIMPYVNWFFCAVCNLEFHAPEHFGTCVACPTCGRKATHKGKRFAG